MKLKYALCMLLAPAVAHAAAFPWALPEPTIHAPAPDNWSPAPTAAAQLPGFELFRRQAATGGNTCGFISGLSQSSITCQNSALICATNTLYGVNGCCDPLSLDACIIPTTCIPSTALSTLCTDALCSSNSAVLKCTAPTLPECYKYMIIYSKTTMTQHGCASQAFTSTALRSWGEQIPSSVPLELYRTQTVTVLATPTNSTPMAAPKKQNLAPIIGGTIGACTFISLVILAFVVYRRRKAAQVGAVQTPVAQYHDVNGGYDPHAMYENDSKSWQLQRVGPVLRENNAVPEYPGMGVGQYGIVEVDGVQRPVEVQGEEGYRAREYVGR